MRTEYRRVGDDVLFVALDVTESHREAARALYFEPIDDGFARRFPAASRHLERAYEGFARHVEDLLRQHAGEQIAPWDAALEALLREIDGKGLDCYLVGSAALAVRGLDLAPGDVDLVLGAADAYRLGDILADSLMEPVRPSPGWIGECFGRAFLHASVEWIGGVDPAVDEQGPNDFGPVASARLETVDWRGHSLRVPPLDLLLAVNERRGRADRATLIRAEMARLAGE
jgi:hypothetical protein